MKLRVFTYKNCGTCKKAVTFLNAHSVEFQERPIRETPPSKAELKRMLGYVGGNVRKLFNTSGGDYKALGLKEKLLAMSDAEAIELLASNGNLVKRPFVLGEGVGTVGFDEAQWRAMFL